MRAVPDDLPRRAPVLDEPPPPVDFVDLVADFAAHDPGWLRRDGRPISWRHFVYGLEALSRRRAREALTMASAAGLPYSKRGDEWLATQRILAGY